MFKEEDLEMGIPHSLIEDENGDTTLANDANSFAQDIAGANGADTHSSPTTLLDSERIHDTPPSTSNAGRLPSDANANAVRGNNTNTKMNIQDLIAELLGTNQSGEATLGQVEFIMMRDAMSSNSVVTSDGGRGEDAARAPSSVVSTIQDDFRPADAGVPPIIADEPPPVSTHLTGLDGLACENGPPMKAEDESASPLLENTGTASVSSVAEFEGVPQNQEEHYDVESPSSYHSDAAAGNHLNSPFGESSPLFADDPATRNMTAVSPFSELFTGLEEANQEDVPPLPPAIIDSQIEDEKMRGGLVQSDNHNDGPPAPADVENEFGGSNTTMKLRGEVPEQARDEDDGPDPFSTATTFEDTNITEKVRGQAASEAMNEHGLDDVAASQLHSDSDTPAIIRNENEAPPQTNTADLGVSSPVDANHPNDVDPYTLGVGITCSDIDIPSGDGNEASSAAPACDVDQDGSVMLIPEAYLVERRDSEDRDNGEVVIATQLDPPVPFYKQKQVVCFLSVLMLITISIAVGITSSFNRTPERVTELIVPPISSPPSDSPSNSIAPTTVRSSPPSYSPSHSPSVMPTTVRSSSPSTTFTPSSSPSSCLDRVSNGKQTLDTPIGSPENPQVAIDKQNMVVVAKDTNLDYVYVVFYSLEDNIWVRKINYSIEKYKYNRYSVALSGSTALVGLEDSDTDAGERAGLVYVYEQGSDGVWNKAQEPMIPEDRKSQYILVRVLTAEYFGSSVDIDVDLVCVVARSDVYIFRRDGGQQWEQIQRLNLGNYAGSCSVAGITIVVRDFRGGIHAYQFDEELGEYVPLQNTLYATETIPAMSLSNHHLVYSTTQYGFFQAGYHGGKEVFIYHRQDTYQPFNLRQHFKSSDFDDDILHALALDGDILVIGGRNKTHVFSEQNGAFEKSLSLNQGYDSVQISGRSLIATTDEEVHAIAIDDCTQAVPTQTPSLSSSPTESPSSPPSLSTGPSQLPSISPSSSAYPSESSAPSMSPSPSARPSASFSPTETCYWIDVSVLFDEIPTDTSWDVQRINDVGDNIVVKTYQGTYDDRETLRKESMCLEEGQYEVTIYDSRSSSCGHYNVTSYGALIVEGKRFGRLEKTTSFSLPLTPAPSATPSESSAPSMSPSSSARPSASFSPTETCYWIDVSVLFDEIPTDTSWDVQRINDVGDNIVVKTYQGTYDDRYTLRKESMRLEEGQYQFTIYDSFGDGFYGDGHYNVTSCGVLIVEGGVRQIEATTFSLPFSPASPITP